MKKCLLLLALLRCGYLFCPSLTKIIDTEEAESMIVDSKAVKKQHDPQEVMNAIAQQFSEMQEAQTKLSEAFSQDKKKDEQLKIIEKYQQAMDYQQVNLDKLRTAIK